jgi:hypothetical protein
MEKRRQDRSLPARDFYLYKAENAAKKTHPPKKNLSTDTQWKIRRHPAKNLFSVPPMGGY